MPAHGGVDPHRRARLAIGGLDPGEFGIDVLSHAVQPLEFELRSPCQRLDRADGIGVVGGKRGIDRVARRQHPRRAGQVGHIGRDLAGEHRVIAVPADLPQLDLAVPVGALDQPDHDPPAMPPRQLRHPVHQRHRALLVGLQRQAKPLPAAREQAVVGHQRLDDVQRQFQPLGLFGVDGEVDVGIARFRRQIAQHRHQRGFRGFRMSEVIAGIERGKLHRDTGGADHAIARLRRDPVQRGGVGLAIALRIGKGHRRFAQHVEAVGQPFLALGRGAPQRFVDGAAEHELSAQDLHRLQGCLPDHRFAQPPDRALQAGAQPARRFAPLLQDLPRQHQRERGGVDERAVAVAHPFRPVDPGQLVMDQRVGGGGVRHAQQRFGQAHQRDAFLGPQPIGLQERVQPAGLVRPRAHDQLRGQRLRGGMDRAGGRGLQQPLGQAGLLFHAIGAAQGGAVQRGRLRGGLRGGQGGFSGNRTFRPPSTGYDRNQSGSADGAAMVGFR